MKTNVSYGAGKIQSSKTLFFSHLLIPDTPVVTSAKNIFIPFAFLTVSHFKCYGMECIEVIAQEVPKILLIRSSD